jgi:hypothetical protein
MQMIRLKNWNCDGGHCTDPQGEVRVFPIGAGGNLILCFSCFTRENRYRRERATETGRPDDFPQVKWSCAEIYQGSAST